MTCSPRQYGPAPESAVEDLFLSGAVTSKGSERPQVSDMDTLNSYAGAIVEIFSREDRASRQLRLTSY